MKMLELNNPLMRRKTDQQNLNKNLIYNLNIYNRAKIYIYF